MAKGFGIAALVFALIAIFIPFGFVLSGIAILLACVAALAGDRTFTIATTVIAVVNTLFLSPSTWIFLGGNDPSAQRAMTTMIVVGVALPIIAIVLNATGKVVLKG
jgi:hypothetical protein